MIKRAQKNFGSLFTVSGVITAFRRSAVHSVGYWSPDMLTEDIDITWKLQRAGWKVNFEPHALVLDPDAGNTARPVEAAPALGHRRRAGAGARTSACWRTRAQNHMWPLLLEMCASVIWSYLMLLLVLLWLAGLVLPAGLLPIVEFALPAAWQRTHPRRGLPAAVRIEPMAGQSLRTRTWAATTTGSSGIRWCSGLINTAATVAAYPQMLSRSSAKRARWVSPDRGLQLDRRDTATNIKQI